MSAVGTQLEMGAANSELETPKCPYLELAEQAKHPEDKEFAVWASGHPVMLPPEYVAEVMEEGFGANWLS